MKNNTQKYRLHLTNYHHCDEEAFVDYVKSTTSLLSLTIGVNRLNKQDIFNIIQNNDNIKELSLYILLPFDVILMDSSNKCNIELMSMSNFGN